MGAMDYLPRQALPSQVHILSTECMFYIWGIVILLVHYYIISSPPYNCDLIIIGRVDSPSYEKLDIICEAIKSGTKCITLNKDLTYPISKTELKPGNGQIAKYVESKSSQILDSLGKEGHLYSQYFFDRKIKLDYVVGDRVDTDIIFGNNVGAKSILVESSIENHMSTTIADERFKDFPSFVSSII